MYKVKAFSLVAVLILSHTIYTGYPGQVVTGVTAAESENLPPLVEIVPDVSSGKAPLIVHFDGDVSDDGEILSLEWDFEGDGTFEVARNIPRELKGDERLLTVRNELKKEFTYTKAGIYHVLLRVTDDKEESCVSSVTIQVFSDVPWLDIVPCSNEFAYMARAGYEVFFTNGITGKESVRFQVRDTWISYTMKNQVFGEVNRAKGVPSGNQMWYKNVFSDIDVRYTVYEDLLLEEFIVYKKMLISFIEQEFTVKGVEYVMNEDGSIGFYSGETLMFSIPRPVMYELNNPEKKSYGLHYEIIQKNGYHLLRKVIDDVQWLKTAKYPVVIDSSTQGELADPWEQQGLTPYGQYFENLNEYVDPLTGHLTIRHTDYFLSGRGLDLSVNRVYSTVVAYKEDENTTGGYIPIATYQEAPTDLGCGWSLDFPWIEIDDDQPGKYMHLPRGVQVKTNFQNGVWVDETYGFAVYQIGNTYVRYRRNGIQEEFDSKGRIISITDLNGNAITFSYEEVDYSGEKLTRITDTAGRVLHFSYANGKLMSISDGTQTTTYTYSGDKLVAVQDPLGRVTSYEYLAGNSFLITGVYYPTGGFSSYEYAVVKPESGRIAPYKSANSEDGGTAYYVYKVDSHDTVTWTSPQDINSVSVSAGRPCVLQRDDGSLVMYYKDKYVWEETVWKCQGGECWEETIVHTEYWIKRSVSTDQHHWSSPENVVQVKSTTGNPIVIEKQDGSFIMYYKDKYVWTEQNCYWEGRCPDCQYVCDTITHTEYWIYRRTSSDGLIWGSAAKVQKTTLTVRDIAVIQKQDSTFLMCYTDKVGSSFYIRQKTSNNGITWSSPSNIIQVNNGTGNPALIQRDSGTVYLAYRKDSSVYVLSNSGSGWSSPVETTASAQGDPALLDTDTDIVIIYKGEDGYCFRISSSDGINWSSPSQIAPNKSLSNPASVARKDRFYRVTAQYISASALDLVKVLEFSYEGDGYLTWSSDVLIRDAQTLQSSMHFEYDSKGRTTERISKDENGIQTEKIVYTYNSKDQVVRQDVYAGTSTDISYSVIAGYDDKGNTVYTRDPGGAEHFYSYANTSSENQFVDSKGAPVNLFSNQFYTNTIPPDCHILPVGEAFINSGKAQETYYQYDANGNLIETKTLFPTRNYKIFSGIFDENNQTTFEFDLTGLIISDGILVISSTAVPYAETLHETHSETGIGWQNSGSWQGKYFFADYIRCHDMDCFDGQTKIGLFEHYPGSPNYTGHTTWVEDRTQYVKTNYSAIINEYPEKVDYKLNNNSWAVITTNLGSGTTSVIIPSSSFVQGVNTLQFQESNTYSTQFEWTLYIDQGAIPEEYVTRFTYDSYGNMTSITDAPDNTTLFGYDANYGYLTSLTNALNHTITAAYDFNTGLATSITDAKGNTTSFEYDILGRVTKRIHPDLSEVEAVYDDQNNRVIIYDELDHYVTRYYDGLSRLVRIEWYLSPTIVLEEMYTYNYLNKLKTRTDPGGHTYLYEYDSSGRITKVTNPDNTVRETQYNDMTNTMSVSDENQHKTEYHYDWVGNLVWVKEYTDPVNYYVTQYTYDNLGNLTSFTDSNGNTTFYSFDSFFGMTEMRYPDSTAETFSYDAVGNLLQKTDAHGTTTFLYNSIYQLVGAVYPDSTSVSFEYDMNGNRTSMTDSEGITSYTYDERNHCTSETRTIEGIPYVVYYAYDAASRLVSLTYPDQSVVTYEYDSLNRLTAVPEYAQFTYNADSLFESMTYGNGIVTTYQYDYHRPGSVHAQGNGSDLLIMNYQYDSVGNVTELEYNRRSPDQQWMQSSETFQYDWLDRLVSAQGDYGLLTYSYDPVGNRVSQNGIIHTYNEMNELLSTSDGLSFVYDENGNTVTKTNGTDTWVYTYDSRNLLTQVEENQQIIALYSYDGNGCRTKKTEWIESLQEYQTIIYVYSGTNVIYEKNLGTGQEATYIYGPTGRIAKKVNGLTDYYHTDHLGSTRLITDESGNTVTDVTYTPFGESVVNGEEDHYLYTGKEKDLEDLYYYGARYYDPEIGRFTTRDPLKGKIESPQTLNRYTYCLNNPLKYIDPLGMDCVFVILPDGTISYEVADILNRLRDAVNKLDWDDVQGEMAEGDLYGALEDILREIFPDAEFDVSSDLITVRLESGYVLGFTWRDSTDPRLNPFRWGFTEQLGAFGANIYLNKDLIKDAGDLFCVLSHELTHAYLHKEFSTTELKEMSNGDIEGFHEAVAYTIEWRIMQYISDDYLSDNFKSHVNDEYSWAFLYHKLGPSYDK